MALSRRIEDALRARIENQRRTIERYQQRNDGPALTLVCDVYVMFCWEAKPKYYYVPEGMGMLGLKAPYKVRVRLK